MSLYTLSNPSNQTHVGTGKDDVGNGHSAGRPLSNRILPMLNKLMSCPASRV